MPASRYAGGASRGRMNSPPGIFSTLMPGRRFEPIQMLIQAHLDGERMAVSPHGREGSTVVAPMGWASWATIARRETY
jgi:hypothetical protein